jgi:hypothetical protein
MTHTLVRQPIPAVVQQHAEESAVLRHIRSVLVRAPHVRLRHLRRLDDRIAAHLDGLAVAGAYGTALCRAALERAGAGEVFALAVRLIDERDDRGLDRLAALAATLPDARRGLLSALGWVSAAQLRGLVQPLLASGDAQRRALAIAACRLHRADPGDALAHALDDADAGLRAAAWRAAGELGRADLLERARDALSDRGAATAFEGRRVRLPAGRSPRRAGRVRIDGARRRSAEGSGRRVAAAGGGLPAGARFRALARQGGAAGARAPAPRDRGLRPAGRRALRALAGRADGGRHAGTHRRRILHAAHGRRPGRAGPGAQAARTVPGGPSDDPADDDVALDADESLPWPDRARVERWWRQHADGMPLDRRSFMGQAPAPEPAAQVLREGTQRQRFVAARHLCLLVPGTRLFPVCAPSWRQQRLLAA